MSNKYKPELLVLPEDDATRQIANGFFTAQGVALENNRMIRVLPEVGGWKKVLENFIESHFYEMRNYPKRMIVLLIDFDNQYQTRFSLFNNKITSDLQERVFVLGVRSEPEDLRGSLGYCGFEKIGAALAQDCYDKTNEMWGHELLKHNESELQRMTMSVRPLLFLC